MNRISNSVQDRRSGKACGSDRSLIEYIINSKHMDSPRAGSPTDRRNATAAAIFGAGFLSGSW